MQAVHSRREFDFVPQTYVLPADLLLFKRVFEEAADTKESKWIIKPVCILKSNFLSIKNKINKKIKCFSFSLRVLEDKEFE